MKYKPKYFGIIEETGGKKVFKMTGGSRNDYENFLDKMETGQEMEMTMSKKFKPRTSGQPGEGTNFNGYLWGIVYKIIADEMGELDYDYIHNWAQIAVENVTRARDGSKVPKGTSDMSGGEFSEYCQKVRIWASQPGNICEHGLYIPDPNQVDYDY